MRAPTEATAQLLRTVLLRLLPLLIMALSLHPATAAIDTYQFDDSAAESQFHGLIAELRCPKCQNQNLADSDAPLAADLRQKVYVMVRDGKTDSDIKSYLVERYGDFVTYRPPLKPLTWPLWFGPVIGLVIVVHLLVLWIRRRSREPTSSGLADDERARLDDLLSDDSDGRR